MCEHFVLLETLIAASIRDTDSRVISTEYPALIFRTVVLVAARVVSDAMTNG